jgi:hypothetical protein
MAGAALAPVAVGAGAGVARATPDGHRDAGRHPVLRPVPTTDADWAEVAAALRGRGGVRDTLFHLGFPRDDLRVVSRGVTITPALALGTHVSFARYEDGSSLLMGDLVVTEEESQRVASALGRSGLVQTAIHKHLFGHHPGLWWVHVHGHGHDAAGLARGLRAALDETGTPPQTPRPERPPLDFDTAGVDEALGVAGARDDTVHKCVFVRRETVVDGHLELPAGFGSTSAFLFQGTGDGRAALTGDFCMTADEVGEVLPRLRRGGIDLVSLHSHGLREEPRLFFLHVWGLGDPVRLARALRPAVEITNVVPGVAS